MNKKLKLIELFGGIGAIRKALISYMKTKNDGVGFMANDKEYTSEGDNGIVFGRKKVGRRKKVLITKPSNRDGHTLVIGGPGSGKSSCIAIPTLRRWRHPVFAIDIKGELHEKTKAYRDEQKIKVFNPTDRNAYGFDPFYMLGHTDNIYAEVKALALAIIPLNPQDKNPYFTQAAQGMLTGLLLFYYECGYDFSEAMLKIQTIPIAEQIQLVVDDDIQKAKIEINQFDGMDAKTLSNVFSTLSNAIIPFASNDDLQRALGRTGKTITPHDLDHGYDIYLCIPEHKLEQWNTLLSMMVNQFLKAFERRSEGATEPILFLIDEFARLGKIDTVAKGLATLRSKTIHMLLFVQSKLQLDTIYGKETSGVIADHCTYKAILKASEPSTQEWCSKLVGTYDKEKHSTSLNNDRFGMKSGDGDSYTTEEKRIIKPEEFAYMNHVVCLFPTGYMHVEKAPYYLEEN